MSTSPFPSPKTTASGTEVLYWRITDSSGRLLKMQLLALLLGVAFGLGFIAVAQQLGRAPRLNWRAQEGVVFVVGLFVVLALHEWMHGAIMRLYGARPRFGFFARGGMFYAKAPGHAFTRQQYLVVVLGPLVSLSLLAVVGIGLMAGTPMVWVIALWAIMNASAANADVWISALLLKYPATATVVDERDGLRILVPSDGTPDQSGHDRPGGHESA